MKVVVIGSNGQVGFELQRHLNISEHTGVCFDRSQLDICDEQQIREVLRDEKPDIVINAAAYTSVDKAETETEIAYAVNATAPGNIAEVCEEMGAAILHISTDYVFAGDSVVPYVETDLVAPTGVYGSSKLAGERAVASACKRHIILRTSWVFGAHGNNFVKTMLHVASGRDRLDVVSDQYGAPTSAQGITCAILEIVDRIEKEESVNWGVYHYSGAPFASWFSFAQAIFAAVNKQGFLPHDVTVNAITTAEYPTQATRPLNSRLDCSKIHREFGILPDDWQLQLTSVLDRQQASEK